LLKSKKSVGNPEHGRCLFPLKKNVSTLITMTPADQVFRYETELECFTHGGMGKIYYLNFPYEVEELFGKRSAVRMEGTFNNVPVDRALMPRKDGPHFLMMNKEMCRKAGVRVGDKVRVVLQRVPNPNEVPLPEELAEALELEPGARQKFDRLSPGRQRNITIYIKQAKRPETRAQRAVLMLERLLNGFFPVDKRKTAQKSTSAEE
jgi:hypothetical protein